MASNNNILIIIQLIIEGGILVLFLLILRNLRVLNHKGSLGKTISLYENLLKEAKELSSSFHQQLKEKQRLINKINRELDEKISNFEQVMAHGENSIIKMRQKDPLNNKKNEIIELNKKGFSADEIAHRLSITKEEVNLILNFLRKTDN